MQNHSREIEYVYAGFWIRLAAYMIDFFIVMITLGIIDSFLGGIMTLFEGTILDGNILFHYTLTDITDYLLTAAYFILMTYYEGGTIGKKMLKLQVISVKGDGKLRLFDVVYRETIGRFLSDLFQGIGYLTVVFTEEKTGIHDMLCGTRVIYPKKMSKVIYMAQEPQREEKRVKNQEDNQEEIQAQWDKILNPQKEEIIPQEEEQKTEGDS